MGCSPCYALVPAVKSHYGLTGDKTPSSMKLFELIDEMAWIVSLSEVASSFVTTGVIEPLTLTPERSKRFGLLYKSAVTIIDGARRPEWVVATPNEYLKIAALRSCPSHEMEIRTQIAANIDIGFVICKRCKVESINRKDCASTLFRAKLGLDWFHFDTCRCNYRLGRNKGEALDDQILDSCRYVYGVDSDD